jgi:hypothetical protein
VKVFRWSIVQKRAKNIFAQAKRLLDLKNYNDIDFTDNVLETAKNLGGLHEELEIGGCPAGDCFSAIVCFGD